MNANNFKWMKATGIVVIFICCFWIGLGSILNVLNATVIDGGYMNTMAIEIKEENDLTI